ncbi:nitrogenase component 1 [Eubacteriales bacterium KG127]
MTKKYTTSITPDSITGILMALEGVKDTITILNGPSGCKFYNSAVSDGQRHYQRSLDPLYFPEEMFFGQPRIPCTYLDKRDYVYGSQDKLEQAINYISTNLEFSMLCIVNSPGAALIGDDLEGILENIDIPQKTVTFQTPGFSENFCDGFEDGVITLLKNINFHSIKKHTQKNKQKKSVNLLGISIYHNNFQGDIGEIKRLLTLCNIDVNTVVCGDCEISELENIPLADLNVVVRPEFGFKTAHWLNSTMGMEYYIPQGPPIGFSQTEKFILDILDYLGLGSEHAQKFIDEMNISRSTCYYHISRINSLTGLPRGVSYALEGTWSDCYSYANFFTKYFGMIPDSISIKDVSRDEFCNYIIDFLKSYKVSKSLDKDILDTEAKIVFADGNTISKLKLKGKDFSGIENSLPSIGYINVIKKTQLGLSGALLLTELILNGMQM